MMRPVLCAAVFMLGLPVNAAVSAEVSELTQRADRQLRTGQFRDVETTLLRAAAEADRLNDHDGTAQVAALEANLLIAMGRSRAAESLAMRSLEDRPDNQDPNVTSMLWGALGTSRALLEDPAGAGTAFERSADAARRARRNDNAARALANAARAAIDGEDPDAALRRLSEAITLVRSLENSPDKALLLTNLGRTAMRLSDDSQHRLLAHELFEESGRVAQATQSGRARSFARGYTAELYEMEGRWQEALDLNRQAAFWAQTENADDALYRWEWATARGLNQLGDSPAAIASYRRAVDLLEALRHQVPFTYGERGSQFRRSIEPVYFGLVEALFGLADRSDREGRQSALTEARDTVELLKAAELRNYFGDDCVEAARVERRVGAVSQSAVVVYPVPMQDRLELLVSRGDALERFQSPISRAELEVLVRNLRYLLEKRITREYLTPARALYRHMIEPLAGVLDDGVDTLVFVPHGVLNLVPMGALHDGRQHLIERFAVAVVPGLELTDPQPMDKTQLNLLLAGLSRSTGGFPTLAHVPVELENAASLGNARTLLDQEFRVAAVSAALQETAFNIVHIATHAEFNESAESSYLLAFDGRIDINELERSVGLFRYRSTPLELLTLSACDTATGSDRAALGLSGIAIKAGARSAIGTLWPVNDQSSAQLVSEFYGSLSQPRISRAQALRTAQLAVKQDRRYWHPGYWSAFILISNWL